MLFVGMSSLRVTIYNISNMVVYGVKCKTHDSL